MSVVTNFPIINKSWKSNRWRCLKIVSVQNEVTEMFSYLGWQTIVESPHIWCKSPLLSKHIWKLLVCIYGGLTGQICLQLIHKTLMFPSWWHYYWFKNMPFFIKWSSKLWSACLHNRTCCETAAVHFICLKLQLVNDCHLPNHQLWFKTQVKVWITPAWGS